MGSGINRLYALRTDEEARAYLSYEHETVSLRGNYLRMMLVQASLRIRSISGRSEVKEGGASGSTAGRRRDDLGGRCVS